MIARGMVAAVAGLLIAATIVRNAAVGLLAATQPAEAAQVWPDHPDVRISSAMTQIALAARAGRQAPTTAFPLLQQASVRDPLAAEPFLVSGVRASLRGEGAAARQAFEAAQWRDPRSLPAAYFLADHFLRIGDVAHGLEQIAAFARLSPGGGQTLGPYIASFASNPANWPALRNSFRANPILAGPAFDTLSNDIRTVPALLALADPKSFTAQAPWMPRLLDTLIKAGRYDQARSLWTKASGIGDSGLLYDTSFKDQSALPPFNWLLTQNSVGLAERQKGGRLHVLFYGQEDGILAAQLLTLPPGNYRLSYQRLGGSGVNTALTWSVWCDKSTAAIASVTVQQGAERGLPFVVPNDCPAQWLRLSGTASDIAQQVDLTIAGLRLTRTGHE